MPSQHNYYQYDKIGRLSRGHNSERTVSLAYHTNGLLGCSQQGHWQLNYGYNAQGQRSSLQLPDGNQVQYQYTEHGQLSQVCFVSDTAQSQSLSRYQYNSAGLNTKQILGNGIELNQRFNVYSRLVEQQWLKKGQKNKQHNQEDSVFSELRTYQYDL